MLWNDYLRKTGSAIQKGFHTGVHLLEGGLQTYATMKGAMELGSAAMPYIRGAAAAAALL